MTNAILMLIAATIGLAGSPWVGFAIAASMLVLVAIPQQLELLKRYAGEPKTDIVLGMLFEFRHGRRGRVCERMGWVFPTAPEKLGTSLLFGQPPTI